MRAAILAASLAGILAMTTAASAKPLTPSDAPFALRLDTHFAPNYARPHGQSDGFADRNAAASQSWQPAALGSFQAETVSDIRPGRHKTVMQYRLNGVQLMGGAVGGSLSGRGAVLTLHWPSGE